MARSMWKGAISFGLVHIPVDMYAAVSNNGLDLNMLDRRDFSPIGFRRYNKNTEKEVGWDDIIKGYEYAEGEYVVLSDEDLRRANPESTQTIDILSFVDAADVPLIYYDQPYYLAPGKGGAKVYALLRDVLKQVGKIGIAHVVIRVKQHLAALVCVGDTIVMNTLRYPDEIRDPSDLKIPAKGAKSATVTDKELKMAMALVQGMSEDWAPQQYHDTYREDVMALIEKKIKAKQTKTITMPDPDHKPAKATNVVDLVALLQASLGKKPGKAARADDDEDDDDPPPPKRAPKPAAAADEDAPAPRARKREARETEDVAASAGKKRTAAKPAAKVARAAAKAPPAKAQPVRRKKAA